MRWRVSAGGLAQPALLAAGLALTVLPGFSSAFGGELPCDVPDELMQVDDKLPHLAERLRAEQPVRIVAIGGASTTGLAAGSSDLSYPHRLQEILTRWYPSSTITVVNRGVPRQTARQMLERFPTDVIPEDPVLVIWETGTTDAVRGVGVDEFAATLQSTTRVSGATGFIARDLRGNYGDRQPGPDK